MRKNHDVLALLVAAGGGSRFGEKVPKQYYPLLNKPMLAHSVKLLVEHPGIKRVYLVLSPGDTFFERYEWPSKNSALIPIFRGGNTRAQSVKNALLSIRCATKDWILVHDAARPCLSNADLDAVVNNIASFRNGAVLGRRVTDTMKRVNDGNLDILETVDREKLWCALTPQIFRYDILVKSLTIDNLETITDKASAVEKMGISPRIIQCVDENPKITFKEDIAFAEFILGKRFLKNGG